MDEQAFRESLKATSPLQFCRQHLFAPDAWAFTERSGLDAFGSYQDFRLSVANVIDTSPNNVAIVGSGKFGFSMAPTKALRPFGPQSDIDVVIVSSEMFNAVWKDIRTAIYNGYRHLSDLHRNQVILRFIVLSTVGKYDSGYLRDTAIAVQRLAKELNLVTRLQVPFKFRIYDSWSDVELYHTDGIARLKDSL